MDYKFPGQTKNLSIDQYNTINDTITASATAVLEFIIQKDAILRSLSLTPVYEIFIPFFFPIFHFVPKSLL